MSASAPESSAQQFALRPLLDYPQRDDVLSAAAQRARCVDDNECSPFETLRELGAQGLLDLGLEGSIAQQAAVPSWPDRRSGYGSSDTSDPAPPNFARGHEC